MADVNELRALQSSFLGAMDAAAALEAARDRVMSIDPQGEVSADDLEEIGRLSLAHAVAAQALRGLVESMRARRGGQETGA